ncbi:MAG TPA: S8 family serine peptidase [Kofleriaceae bacterium]|nr:S8 family serine peptidase [Kofleriaceae bacterium]
MRREYIILRRASVPRGTRDILEGVGLGARRGIEPPPALEFEHMAIQDAQDMARAPEVQAVVPAIPLKLIRPMAREADAPALDPGTGSWGVSAVGAIDTPYTGKGVKVAVLDTGIDKNHAAFQGVELTEVDFTGEGNGDRDGHGTHCAATIFGRDVGGARIGVARGVSQAFIGKVIGTEGGSTASLLRAIHAAADAGCQIMSMSLGFDFPGAAARLQEQGFPPDLATAVALADYRANVRLFDRLGELIQAESLQGHRELLLFAASGNESKRNIDARYEMPAAPPSEAAGFTSVGALGRGPEGKLCVASFSNVGCNVCAPGVDIISARAGTTNGLVAFSGTSMATPHAAGVAALHLEKENAQPPPSGFLRFRPGVLFRILGSASLQLLAPGVTAAQAGLGLIRAPT